MVNGLFAARLFSIYLVFGAMVANAIQAQGVPHTFGWVFLDVVLRFAMIVLSM